MAEDLPSSLFNILRQDLAAQRIEISARLDNLAAQMVTQATLQQVQANQKERDDRQDARLRALEEKDDGRDREVRQVVEDQRKARAQLFTSIGLAVLGLVLTVIGGVVVWTLQSALSQLVGAGG